MKRLTCLCLFIFLSGFIFAQELSFPNSVIVAGGSHTTKYKKNVSRWRIGHINIFQISADSTKSIDLLNLTKDKSKSFFNWQITAFPNPVNDFLQIQFDIPKQTKFGIIVTDITGRKIIKAEDKLIIPNQVVELDLRGLISAIYIINIRSENDSFHKILKVNKR